MVHRLASLFSVVAVLSSAACGGGDDKGYGDPLTLDSATRASITAAVQSAASLASLESAPGDTTAIAKVGGLYGSMSVLLAAKQASGSRKPSFPEGAQKPFDESCLTVAAGKVTYASCDYGSGTINGSVSWSSNTFTIDLSMTSSSAGATFLVTQKGNLSISPGSIKGTLDIRAEVMVAGTSSRGSFGAEYDITLIDGCATGGLMEVHAQGSASGGGGSGSYDLWVKAVFGPTCGDVTVY
jgi:hypothetical protein